MIEEKVEAYARLMETGRVWHWQGAKSEEAKGRQDIIEAFSTLAQSHFLLNHGRYNMPQEAHDSIEYVQKKLADAQHLVAISKAWDAFAKSKEGRAFIKNEGATLEKLMEESGASVAGRYAAAKLDATVFEAVREAYEEGSSITRAAEVLEEYAKEQDELDHPAAPEEKEGISKEDSPTGEEISAEAMEDAPAVDDETGDFEAPEGTEKEQGDRGAGLVNGMYAEAGDGSVYGVARVEDLSISADVPQFKKKEVAGQREAANEDGTTHELSGGWNAKSAPIIVWRRRDGRLEVISGRHRLAHAKKNGVGHIAVRVYDEDAAHDAAWAKLYDVEVNILEGTCGAIDVAFYFRHNPMSLAEAEARGLMPKTQAGGQTAASRMGIMIATRASGYVFDSMVNGGVSAEDAYMACVITESAEGQELALKARRGTKGKKRSWEYVTALVRGAEQMAPEGGGGLMDLFGFDEGFAKRAEKIANYVEAVRKQLRRRIDVLSGAGSLQRKGEMTKEMGVKIDRPEDAVKIIERLARLDAAYEAMDPGLGIVAAAEAWDGKSDVQIDWRRGELSGNSEQVGDGSFSVSARFLGTAQEAKDALRSVQGRVFRNEATGIEAMVTSDTVGKSYAAQMSVRNLMALGYSQEEARQIHYSAFAHVHEIFERADYGEFEKNYAPEQKKGRAGAWHYYGTVDIEGKGSFDVNVTAVVPDRNGGDNRLFSLELTIENPADGRLGYPHTMGPSFNAAGSSGHRLAAYRSNVEKEILKIREEAMKDGTYMKAPNGEESKLDERTWCVVRTRAFKDYFGDWENEPEGASKVVDSNGEPLVVYHGTPEDFGNVFEDKQPKDRDFDPNYHRGTFWFTDRRFTAQTYQGKAVFTRHPEPLRRLDTEWEHEDVPAGEHADVLEGLKKRTVFRAYDTRHSLHGVRVKLSEAFDEDGMLKEDYYVALELKEGEERVLPSGKRPLSSQLFRASRGSNYFLHEGVKPPRTHKEALEFYARFEGVGDRISVPVRSRLYACFLNIRNPKVYDYEGGKFRDMGYRAAEAQAEGHDGVIVKNVYDPGNYPDAVLPGMSIGVFSPGQIKSVDNRGTFDAGNADISMSVAQAKERGLMKDGVMEVGNGVIVDGRGDDFSASVSGAQQASPHLFREPDLEKVGTGEGNQSQGWGLYWSTRWSANAFYHRQFSTAGEPIAPGSKEERLMRLLGEALNVEEVDERVLYDLGGAMDSFGPSAMRDELYSALESKGASEEDLEFFFEAFENMEIHCSETDEGGLWVDVESRVGGEDMFVRINPDGKFAVNYMADLDVDDGNVLHYDEDAGRLFDEHPGLLEAYRKEGGEYTGKEKGRDVYWGLARALGSDKAASQWLDAHGIRGNKYEDGMSRGKKDGEKMYNYVIFNEDYIKITHVNNRHPWSEYSEGNADWERVEDVSFSVRNLAAVHTLSVENFLRQAREWGGIPLPSVAVTRLDRPYDWEVDHEPMVMLVGRPGMVDPEGGAEVYARDAWMGMMPEVVEERGEDGKVRRFFYDGKGEKVEATLENMTGYLMRRKQKGNSAHETPDAARSLMARRLRSMEDVKGRRRMLQAEPENRVTDGEIYRWMDMATEYDWGWSAKKARTLFRVLADVDEVTKGNVMAAIEGSEEEDLMELQNGLDEDSAFIRETVRVMKEMRKERRNYVEATPRRVVGMDEWVYAVYQDDVPGRDEVRRVCRENGIVPVEYKAGERDKALGRLIDDAEVSFSVIGEHARTWGKYKERAFTGRDDGRMRAEIDASKARLTRRAPVLRKSGADEAVEAIYGRQDVFYGRYEAAQGLEGKEREAALEELGGDMAAAAGIEGLRKEELVRLTGLFAGDSRVWSEAKGLVRERVRDEQMEVGRGAVLEDVLDYEELYEAYPELRGYYVVVTDRLPDGVYGGFDSVFKHVLISARVRDAARFRRALLHEVQHAIQYIEGFKTGADGRRVSGEAYWNNAGEREARNVEWRADMSARERLERAFNETLEEAEFSASLTFSPAERSGLRALREWLDAHGIRGIKYADGASRGRKTGKTYNYVIFNPDYIEVIAINNRHAWSEYSEDNPDWQRPEDVDFSASVAMWKGTLGALMANFPKEGTAAYTQEIIVCPTPAVMRMVGVRPWALVITPAVIEKVTKIKHAVPYEALEQLPEAIAEPICIAVSDKANSIEVITELKEGNDNILVAVRLDSNLTHAPQVKVNRIVSLYGKEWIANLLTHPMLYLDKTKALPWIASRRLQLPPIINLKSAPRRKILTPDDLVKYKVESGQSFSVRGEGLLDRVNLREMAEEEKMSRLMTRARRGAARWRRVFMDDKTSAAEAAMALGEVSSVMEAVYAYLPAGERPVYAEKMKLVEAYARLVETGRVWHRENAKSEGARAKQEVLDEVMSELEKVGTLKGEALRELREGYVREVAGRKLSEVAVSMVEDAVDAVERHLVRREMDLVKRLAEALKPKKLKSGKPAPGKMSAAGYRRFARYMKMVEMSAEEKAERMEELAAKLDKESEAEAQEPIEEEMRELAMFGALGSGRLADVRRGVAELIGFVRGERTSWEGRVELEKEQMKHFARVAVEAMGGVDRNKLAARRDRAKKPLRTILGTQKGFMSLGQMWMAMQGVPALREMAEWSLERLARGNVALGMRERALREAEVAFMAKELGLTSEAARNNFLVDLKKERATGVRKAGEKRVHKVRVSVEEAREIVAMSKGERKARNERIRKEADERGVDAKNIVEDEDVELMAEELRDVGRKKYITTEREYRTEGSEELALSKDNALNIILLAEQADYAESADAQGYTAEVIEALRKFVGKEALAYGYWMRERLGNNGLAEVWEAREGIPFPAVEKYWPGRFDQSSRINERSALDGMSGGNGTRYGMLITRVRHNLNFDESLGATNVFRAALAQQNSYIVMGELTARWRKLLAQRDFAPALEGAMGQERFETFKEFLNLLDGLGARETAIEEAHSRMLGLVQSARAMTVLSLAPATLVKQLSAVLNGTVSGVSGARLLTQMVQDMTSKQPISWREMAELDCIKVRYENTEEYQRLQRMGRNATWSRAASNF